MTAVDDVLGPLPNGRQTRPATPPAPGPDNMTWRAQRDQMKAQQRHIRDARKAEWSNRLRGINRQYWTMAGVGAALVVGVLAFRGYQADQKDTALALAQIAAGGATTDTTAAPVVVEGIPNPLEQMHLTPQARWLIGIDKDGALLPNRSATVLVQMLAKVNPCTLFIGMDAKSTPIITATPTPGFTTLSDCPASSTTLPAATVSGS